MLIHRKLWAYHSTGQDSRYQLLSVSTLTYPIFAFVEPTADVNFPTGFDRTGDFILGDGLKKLGSLLDRGVKVALFYGDRDYQCNWLGGEAISLAIESKLSSDFKKAGYAEIETNDSHIGGFVRQHGNLSFARVFQSGHESQSNSFKHYSV
jgi:carboxypeptidase C (cathepsin A)